MGIWVRSQYKKALVHSNNFLVNRVADPSIITFNEEGLVRLGTYATEERAVQVLDAMQRYMDYKLEGTFEMPKE